MTAQIDKPEQTAQTPAVDPARWAQIANESNSYGKMSAIPIVTDTSIGAALGALYGGPMGLAMGAVVGGIVGITSSERKAEIARDQNVIDSLGMPPLPDIIKLNQT